MRLHSAPRSLEISQFNMLGNLRANLRRSVRDHTMKAFMGRLTWSSSSSGAGPPAAPPGTPVCC